MTTEERITKAKIWLITNKPWFGQLSCYLNPRENNNIPTMSIDIKGNMYYNVKFCQTLSDEKLRAIVCHEILHLAFRHLDRYGERRFILWNFAADIKGN